MRKLIAVVLLSSSVAACGVIGKAPPLYSLSPQVVEPGVVRREVLVVRPTGPRIATVKTVVHEPIKNQTDICYPPGSIHFAPCLYSNDANDSSGGSGGSGY
jgi:hypothetical protein